ncbi:MAG: hypothetical protein GKR89_29545 [Candidatus Latescibacteria bacterium]|nr:hypothetical protein [Candidatus Latescibacterota bacterium]
MDQQHQSRRLYSDKEVGALLKRATELQEARCQSLSHSLSLEEIEQVATEIGISREYLQAAAQELDRRPDGQRGLTLTGRPFLADVERVVAGQLTDEQWEEIVLELRRLTGSVGQVSQLGQAREWSDGGEILQTQVTIRSRRDRTNVQVLKNYEGWAGIAYLMTTFVAATLTGISLDGKGFPMWANLCMVGGGALCGLASARAGMVGWARLQRQKVAALANYLEVAVSQAVGAKAEQKNLHAAAPQALGEGGVALGGSESQEGQQEKVGLRSGSAAD